MAHRTFAMRAYRAVHRIAADRVLTAGVFAFACAVLAVPASATLYKWIDANGRVVYSDQPPNSDVKTETVQGAPPPSNPNAVKDMAAKELDLKKRQTEAADRDKKTDAQRAEISKRVEQCNRAQTQIKQLAAEQIGLVRYNEKGEMVYVDDATRRKERGELEIWVKANCPTP